MFEATTYIVMIALACLNNLFATFGEILLRYLEFSVMMIIIIYDVMW